MDSRLLAVGFIETARTQNPYDDTYGQVNIPWYGEMATVWVSFERDEQKDSPTDTQIQAFVKFIEVKDNFFIGLEKQLFAHYNNARNESELDDDTINKFFPILKNEKDLKGMISLPKISVSYYNGEGWADYIGLHINCCWEEEHGLGVKVVENKVVEIGSQDIIL